MGAKRIVNRDFFTKPAEELAKDLIGKIFCHEVGDGNEKFIIKGRIKATEAYRPNDNVTDANRDNNGTSQQLAGGHLYLYTQKGEGRKRLDIVAGGIGSPESVLIRCLDSYDEGPQRVVWAMDIEDDADGLDLLEKGSKMWLEDDDTIVNFNVPEPRKCLSDKSNDKDAPLYFSAKSFTFK